MVVWYTRTILAAIFLAASLSRVFTSDTDRWQTHYHRLSKILVHNSRASSLLSSMMGHKFSIPEEALRRGLAYMGSNHRLRAAVKRGMEGKQLKIGVVGGSISHGHGASLKDVTGWVPVFSSWIKKAFSNSTVRNGSIPGTPSAYMVVCLDMSVDQDVDIVFAEYILNDGSSDDMGIENPRTKEYERLVRRVLSLPNRPPLIMMQTFNHGVAFPATHKEKRQFNNGIEDIYGSLAQYYDVQWLSLRGSTYRLSVFLNDTRFSWDTIMNGLNALDYSHPSDLGHRIMADLATWIIQQTALDLIIRPFGQEDQDMIDEEMPDPMYAGNTVPTSPMCVHFDALKSLVADSKGFEFVEEGSKKKKGIVGLRPGDYIDFGLNTRRDLNLTPEQQQKGEGSLVLVQLAHLKSYENMGIGLASCASGCKCPDKEIDAHQVIRESQTYLASVMVSQHPNCTVRVTIANRTSSGKHKFKMIGLMVSDSTETSNHGFQQESEFTGAILAHPE